MIEDAQQLVELPGGGTDGFVQLHAAGQLGSGSFRCAACGYGVALSSVLPQCPMCAGTSWERELWHSFDRFEDDG